MPELNHCNLLDKARRRHRAERSSKYPVMSASVPGAGHVVANGKLSVMLPVVSGDVAVYAAAPAIAWDLTFEGVVDGPSVTVVTPADRAKQALDTLLGVMADAESKVAN